MKILEPRHYQEPRYPGRQLHCCGTWHMTPDVIPVKNNDLWAGNIKPEPDTGLWTAPWQEELQGSPWTSYAHRWLDGQSDWGREMVKRDRYLLTPERGVNLYVVSTSYEFVKLLQDYPHITALAKEHGSDKLIATERGNEHPALSCGIIRYQGVDFEKLSKDYDGLWLTQKGLDLMGQWRGQVPGGTPEMTGWSCESIVWFRWCFTAVTLQKEMEPRYA